MSQAPTVDRRPAQSSTHDEVAVAGASAYARFRSTWLAPLVAAIVGVVVLFTLDVPLARADLTNTLPKLFVQILNHAETFGNGYGVAFILATVWTLDLRRRVIVRLAAASWGAGLAANIVKLMVTRTRPFYWLEQGGGDLASQFGAWFPLGSNGGHLQSFPSAHTATAVGLALGLTALYPRGGKLFACFAALVACQRVVADMHYAGDTLLAAAIAWAWCRMLYGEGKLALAFTKWERREIAGAR